jgi:peroxiredoxin
MGCRKAVVLALTLATASGIKVGDMIPDVSLDKGFPPEKVSLKEETKGKKIVLVGLPGAFTPT